MQTEIKILFTDKAKEQGVACMCVSDIEQEDRIGGARPSVIMRLCTKACVRASLCAWLLYVSALLRPFLLPNKPE